MASIQEVVNAFNTQLSTDQIQEQLNRILRVPEVWEALLDRGMDEVWPDPNSLTPLTPSTLAERILGSPLRDLYQYEDEAGSALQGSDGRGSAVQTLLEIAKVAVQLLHVEAEFGAEGLIGRIQSRWTHHTSPLALIWNSLESPLAVMKGLIETGDFQAVYLAINALLANYGVDEVAKQLKEALPMHIGIILPTLRESGEAELEQRVLDYSSDADHPYSVWSTKSDRLAWQAETALQSDSADQAQIVLEQAYEFSQQGTAHITDRMADIAKTLHDPILEGELLQAAFGIDPTPSRRARLALSVMDRNQISEAQAILSSEQKSIEEQIASVKMDLLTGSDAAAHAQLDVIVKGISRGNHLSRSWFNQLVSQLIDLGRMRDTAEILKVQVRRFPMDLEARKDLIQILLMTESFALAVSASELSLVLFPDEPWFEECLARGLEGAGQAEQALKHWRELSEYNSSLMANLANCALQVGEYEEAEIAISKLLEKDPSDGQGLILSARHQKAIGNHDTAWEILVPLYEVNGNVEAAIALADVHLSKDELFEAKAILDRIWQSSPENPRIAKALIAWYRSQNKLGDALEIANAARTIDPKSVQHKIAQGEILLELGHVNDAEAILQEAMTQVPGNWSIRQAMADIYESKGKHSSAIQMIDALPDNASHELLVKAARISMHAGMELGDNKHLAQALDVLDRLEKSEQTDPIIWLLRGQTLEQMENYQEALEQYRFCLRKSMQLDTDTYTQAALGAARSAAEMGDPSLALSILENANERLPDSPEVLALLAEGFTSVNLHEKALESAKRAAKINPDSPVAIRALGKTLSAAGQHTKAYSALKKLTRVQPRKVTNWLELASAAAAVPDIPAARNAIASALLLGRKTAQVIKDCADSLLQIGELKGSLRLLQSTLKIEPDDHETWETFANLNVSQGNYQEAISAWKEIAARAVGDPKVLNRCGKALMDLGDQASAKNAWKQARISDPDNPQVIKSLADAQLQLGEVKDGLGLLDDALRRDSENIELMKTAVNAALDYGDSNRAKKMLSHLGSSSSLDPEINSLLLETYAEADEWEHALEILDHNDFIPTCLSLAIKSIALLRNGDYERSWDAYQAALAYDTHSHREAMICARAASLLGAFDDADRFLAEVRNSGSPKFKLGLVEHSLSVQDARWLYQDLKAPECLTSTQGLDEASIRETLKELKADSHPQISRELLASLEVRAKITYGEVELAIDPTTTHKINDQPSWIDTLVIAGLQVGRQDIASPWLNDDGYQSVWKGLLQALHLEAQGQFMEALGVLETFPHPPIVQPLADFLTARISLAQENLPDAITALNKAILAWADVPAWHGLLASIYQDQSDPEKALPHLQKAVELDPDSGDQQLSLARAFSDCGQWRESLEAFKNAIPKYPESGNLFKEAAHTALSSSDFTLAYEWYERACTLSPSDAHALIGAAQAALMTGKKREAKEYATSALRLAPEDPDVLKGFGDLLTGQGKNETALEAYNRALTQRPESKQLIRARSKVLLEMNRSEEAVVELQSLAELDSSDHESWHFLALAAEKAGDYEAADVAATKAIRLSPINPEYHLTLGRICRARGQLDRALDELTHASSLAETESRIALEIGRVCEERHELDRALDAYQSVITHDPNSFEAFFRSGLIFRSKKNYPQAGGMLKRAVEISPLNRDALHQLAAVRALELIHGRVATSRVST